MQWCFVANHSYVWCCFLYLNRSITWMFIADIGWYLRKFLHVRHVNTDSACGFALLPFPIMGRILLRHSLSSLAFSLRLFLTITPVEILKFGFRKDLTWVKDFPVPDDLSTGNLEQRNKSRKSVQGGGRIYWTKMF